MGDTEMIKTGNRYLRVFDIAIGLYLVIIAAFWLFGAYSFDLSFKITLNGLLKPAAIFLFLFSLKIFLFFYEFRLPAYDPKPGAKALQAIILVVDIFLYVYAFVLVWYVVFGPISIKAPLVVKVEDYSKPLVILAFLIIFRLLAPSLVHAASGKIARIFEGVGENRWQFILLIPILVFAVILRIWHIEQGLDHNIFHTDAPVQLKAVFSYLMGDYQFHHWMRGYPFFSMHFVEYAVILNVWLQGLINYPPPVIDLPLISLTGRWLNVFYGLVMIGLVYQIALYLRFGVAALFAALLMATSITHIQMTKALGNDLPMSFFAALSLFFMARNIDNEKLSNYALAGVAAAISFASKYNGLLVIIPLFLLYSHLHPGRDFIKKFGLPLLAAGFFVITFFLTNSLHWTDTENQIKSYLYRGVGFTSSRGLDPVSAGSKLEAHVKMLAESYSYHHWTLEGILAPVPVWLFVGALIMLLFKRQRNMTFAWLGLILMFIVAKITKPNAAPYHLLHLMPLAALFISKSVADFVSMVPLPKVRFYAIAIFVIFLGYHSIQDTSLYGPKPLRQIFADWVDGNLTDEVKIRREATLEVLAEPTKKLEGRYIWRYHHDMPKAYSGIRDLNHYLGFNTPVRYLPSAHFATEEKKAFIFPDSFELVTTMRLFSTGPQRKFWAFPETQKERLIMRSELKGPILVYVKNDADKINRITGSVGRKSFDIKLNPGEYRVLTFNNLWPSYLYYGKFVELKAGSEINASWYIGDNARTRGDIYQAIGKNEKAIESYFNDGSAYSLMRIIEIADNRTIRSRAAGQLSKNHRAVIESDASSWESISGYSDKYFSGKMIQALTGQIAHDGETTAAGLLIPEKTGTLAGPYIKLMRGYYRASILLTPEDGVTRFKADVTSDMGVHSFVTKEVLPGQTKNIVITLDFEVEKLFEANVEVRVHEIEGGAVTVHGATIESLYKEDAMRLIEIAHDFIDR